MASSAEAVKTWAEGFVVDFLPEIEEPLRRRGFLEGQRRFLIFFRLHVSFLSFCFRSFLTGRSPQTTRLVNALNYLTGNI